MADGKIIIEIDGDSSEFQKEVDGLSEKASVALSQIGEAIKGSVGDALASLASGALSALNQLTGWNGFQSIVSDALDVGMAFENSMSNVASLQYAAGATEAQISSLKDAAEQFGATTQFSMSECADALGFMALAGWDAEQSISALPGVLNLSAASGMGLAQASDMVTDYMSAFSKSVSDYTGAALTAAEFSDKLAFAQANSNTNVAQLGEAFKNCAANMNAAGQQMDTVTALLGTMANQGLRGAESGTVLAAVMRDINSKMEDGAISINGQSIAIADANGNYRDLIDIMADVERATDGMGDTQKAAALSSVFTADSIKGLNLILNAGTDSVRQLEAGLSDCEGAAEDMAKTLNDNLVGDAKALSSTMDAVKNALYEGLEPALRSIVQTITNNVAPALLDLTKSFFDMLNGVPEAGNKVKTALDSLFNWVIDSANSVLPELISNLADGIAKGLPTIVTGITKLAQGIITVISNIDILGIVQDSIKNIGDVISHSNAILRQAAETMISGMIQALPSVIDQLLSIKDTIRETLEKSWKSFSTQGGLLIEAIFSGITKILPEITEKLSERLEQMPKFFLAGSEMIINLISGITEKLPSLLKIVSVTVSAMLGTLMQALPNLIQCGLAIINAILSGIMDNLPLLLDSAVALISDFAEVILINLPVLLDCAVQIVQGLLSGIMDNLPKLAKCAVSLVFQLGQAILDNLPLLIDAALGLIDMLVTFITENIPLLLDCALQIIAVIIDGILVNLPLLLDAAVQIITKLADGIISYLPELLNAVLRIVQSIAKFFSDHGKDFLTLGIQIIVMLIQGIGKNLPALLSETLFIIEKIVKAMLDFDWIALGENIISLLLAGFKGMYDLAIEGATDLIGIIWDAISGTDWVTLGTNILDGIVNGLMNFGDMVSDWGDAFVDSVKAVFDIHSPSKVFENEIGKYLLPGAVIGMKDTLPDAIREISGISDQMRNGFDDLLPDLDVNKIYSQLRLASAVSGASATPIMSGNHYYSTINNYSQNGQNAPSGDIIIPVSIGGQQIETVILSAIEIENARSGGWSV